MRIVVLQRIAATIACASMLASPMAMAETLDQTFRPTDIALRDGGVLVGQLVSVQGTPLAEAPIALLAEGKEIVRVATNDQGIFEVPNLKGGVYQVSAPGHQGIYRLWAPRTAPPMASQGVLAVAQGDFARGQYGPPQGFFGGAMGWISQHPLMTAGIIATAVAIPLALDEDDPAS